MSRIGSVLLAFFLLAGVLWAGRQGRTTSLNAEWAARYDGEIRRVLNVPPSATLEFKRARPGGDDHYAVAVFDARAGEDSYPLELTVSPDGQTVLYEGRTYALDDPFAANRAGIDLTDEPARGPADAPVTIVEYSDYTCSYCRRFFLTQEQPLLEKHAGQVRLVYKHFPLTEHRPGADDVAVAAACAYRHGNEAFWAYHKRLFQEADRLAEGRNLFLQLAREVGLDGSRFARCVDERQGLFDVARDVAEGEELGIRGTPAFFVNGRPVLGLVRPEHFSYIIEQELAAARGR
jgi:protein-disulfide isomerase